MKPTTRYIALLAIGTGGLSQAALVNGDFEATPFDNGWTNSTTSFTSTTAIAPSGSTAVAASGIDSSTDEFLQLTGSGLSTGTIGLWVRPDSLVSGQRTFNLVVGTTVGTSGINLRMNPNGGGTAFSFQTFVSGGTGWVTTPGSTDDFAVGNVYYVEIGFNDLGTAGATFDLAWSGANPGSATTTESATGLTTFQNSGHITGAGATLDRLRFAVDGDFGDYTFDDVTVVPEPSITLLGGLGLLGLLRRRR